MTTRVFIDGEAGTTGLEIRTRLSGRRDLSLLAIAETQRKDARARRDMLNSADIVILCLPDEAAREAVSLIDSNSVRVIDASSAHRTAPGWVYGFPEMDRDQPAAIASASRVTNPGCYPTGSIALLRPLVGAKLLPSSWPVTINAVSGYSGGGKTLIAAFEDKSSPHATAENFRIYGLGLEHKHVEEIRLHSGLGERPVFAPSYGRFYRGMIVEVPLQLWALPGEVTVSSIHDTLRDTYRDKRFVSVASLEETSGLATLGAELLNGTNAMKLFVFGNEKRRQALLVAVLDNLGKGAAGAAVQNLNLMLGCDEATGLA
jgi:N-acetyl-gamma-glutamyl-phosphate reductase